MANASASMNDIFPVHVGIATYIASETDIFAGTFSTDVLNMEAWDSCFFLIGKGVGGVDATGTTVLTVESCDDVTPTTTTAVAYQYREMTTIDTWGAWQEATAAGYTTTAGDNGMIQVRINAESLSSGDNYVRLHGVEATNSAVVGWITAFLTDPRYSQEIPASAIV